MVLIQPIQPILVTIKTGEHQYEGQMISLSDEQLELSCRDYFEKDTQVLFVAKYFRGMALIKEINFAQCYFTYKLELTQIQFQPGLLINTRL